MSFSSDGKYVATTSSDFTARISRTDTGETIAHIDHGDKIRDLSFSPDGKYVATASSDFIARISRTDTGETIARIDHEDPVNAVSFSPDGKYVATASNDNTAHISHTDTGETIVHINHESVVNAVSFSPDGKYVATASNDNTARISRTDTGETIARIDHEDRVTAVSFSPDGKYVVTASSDFTARIRYAKSALLWQEVCSRIRHNLTANEWERYVDANLLNYDRTCPDRPVHESVTRRALEWVKQDKNKALKLLRHIAKIDDNADLNPDTEESDRDPKAVIKQILSSIKNDKKQQESDTSE
ncbi:MAG: WD40 repeat domain-containing protein [Cyanobacteria bacterium P01_E01_bin.42]